MADALRLDISDGFAVITFDKPDARANTLGAAVVAEFHKILDEVKKRGDLKGLILKSGKPGMFIAGADLKELAMADTSRPEQTRALIEHGLAIPAAFESLPFPTAA